MVSRKNYNLNGNEEFFFCLFFSYIFVFLSLPLYLQLSKLCTCLFMVCLWGMKSQSIGYLLCGSECIYLILELEDEVHSMWILWARWLSRMQGQLGFEVKWDGQQFLVKLEFIFRGFVEVAGLGPYPVFNPYPEKLVGERLTSSSSVCMRPLHSCHAE